jgi:SAM-dependent methyltransferase
VLREPAPGRLEFPKATGRHPFSSVAYRATHLAVRLVGERRTFALLAGLARLFHRLAYESAIRLYGEEYPAAVTALDPDALADIVSDADSVLDVGCGIGKWCRLVAPHVRRVVGIDYDPAALQVARARTSSGNVEYRLGDVRDLVGGEAFDVALLIHVLEHIPDPVGFLDSLHGVARRLAVEVPDFENDPVNLPRLTVGVPFASDADHVREYTERTLLDTLASSGWNVESIRKRGGAIAAVAS